MQLSPSPTQTESEEIHAVHQSCI